LTGLIQGTDTVTLLLRSVAIFAVFFLIGQIFCLFWQQLGSKEKEEEVITQAPPIIVQEKIESVKDQIRQHVVKNPKETAQAIDTLIGQ
jgi:hypothetical protein